MRLYTAGIADFEKIRQNNRIYVDKTDLVFRMTHESDFVFLSRPRRFGKSLLCSTLKYYFEGRKDLFEGLAIAELEKDWKKHPVLHFDMSACKNKYEIGQIIEELHSQLDYHEEKYGMTKTEGSPGTRFKKIIQGLHKEIGLKTVVILDEYDAPLLDYLHKPEQLEEVRRILQEFYQMVKVCDKDEQFVFITGITKFSQLSIFSTLNNLRNISMMPQYSALCGITTEELLTIFDQDIQMLADECHRSKEEMIDILKLQYDGYHFGKSSPDIYNPFSLVNALKSGKIDKYWFDSATPSALIAILREMPPLDISDVDGALCESDDFNKAFDSYQAPLPVLYQSGYLTIKFYEEDIDMYTLGFPNEEVRKGFASSLYSYITNRTGDDHERSALMKAYKMFQRNDNLSAFIDAIKTFFAGVPYHWEKNNRNEHYYHALLYTLLMAFGADVRVEEPGAKGRSDITLLMPKGIYIMELKYDDTVQAAIDQIESKGYAEKYRLDGRPVTKVGIAFSSAERNITDWKAAPANA